MGQFEDLKGKTFGFNDGNGNGNGGNNKSNPKIPIEETETEDRAAELCKRKITGNDIEFLLETICKEAQFDKISIEQLLKGYL